MKITAIKDMEDMKMRKAISLENVNTNNPKEMKKLSDRELEMVSGGGIFEDIYVAVKLGIGSLLDSVADTVKEIV